MDALVTLICFLLFTSAFLSIVEIETPVPIVSNEDPTELEVAAKPIQLTLKIHSKEIWIEAGFGSLFSRRIPVMEGGVGLEKISPKDGEETSVLSENSPQYDYEALHQALVEVKQKWPQETMVVLMPDSGVSYDTIIQVIDVSRFFKETDPPLYKKVKYEDGSEIDVVEKELFPKIVFGNTMG